MRSTPTVLSSEKDELAATTVSDYALFGGGVKSGSDNYSSAVDTYNSSSTRSTAPALSEARCYLAATTVGGYALFGGGDDANNSANPTVPESGQGMRTYTIKKGGMLWDISKKYLGTGRRYPEIMSLNALKSTTIYPGQILRIPN